MIGSGGFGQVYLCNHVGGSSGGGGGGGGDGGGSSGCGGDDDDEAVVAEEESYSSSVCPSRAALKVELVTTRAARNVLKIEVAVLRLLCGSVLFIYLCIPYSGCARVFVFCMHAHARNV